MKRSIMFAFVVLISLYGCKDSRKEYIENIKPVVTGLEQLGSEMDSTVSALTGDGISIVGFETKIQDIENRLRKEKENFVRYTAPMELDLFQKNIQEAIAGEELAISAIKSYATRKGMLKLAERQIAELEREEQQLRSKGEKDEKIKNRLSKISIERANLQKQKENLTMEMDAQLKFYSNSHEYFTKMVKAMKTFLKGRSR